MKHKVSIIIPNYNGSTYIKKCINSVVNQTYKNIEIIIIDDESTDNSWELIQEFDREYNNVIIFRQANMNASIARNRGIELATGKYALFLDSDDELFEDSIEIMVDSMNKMNCELVIGNFVKIDSNGNIKSQVNVNYTNGECDNPYDYIGTVPNPSNKLFNLDIIKENKIYFGNVRIGQDLNFFLKYIYYCNKIYLLKNNLYKWRVLEGSISNTYNFKIFDIVESFNDTKRFYKNREIIDLYNKYISAIEYRHYYLQMEKQKNFKNSLQKKVVINYFYIKLKEVDLSESINLNNYKNDYLKCRIKLILRFFYKTKLYYILDKKFSRR